MRPKTLNVTYHRGEFSRLRDQFEILGGVEQSPQTAPNRGVVIGKDDTYRKPRSRVPKARGGCCKVQVRAHGVKLAPPGCEVVLGKVRIRCGEARTLGQEPRSAAPSTTASVGRTVM
jgi:hypothetical protein